MEHWIEMMPEPHIKHHFSSLSIHRLSSLFHSPFQCVSRTLCITLKFQHLVLRLFYTKCEIFKHLQYKKNRLNWNGRVNVFLYECVFVQNFLYGFIRYRYQRCICITLYLTLFAAFVLHIFGNGEKLDSDPLFRSENLCFCTKVLFLFRSHPFNRVKQE